MKLFYFHDELAEMSMLVHEYGDGEIRMSAKLVDDLIWDWMELYSRVEKLRSENDELKKVAQGLDLKVRGKRKGSVDSRANG